MNASYKIKINEGQKSVTCEVAVEGDDMQETIKECKELYKEISKYSKEETLKKYLENN